jgi:restriction system protein
MPKHQPVVQPAKKMSRSISLATKLIFAALSALQERGGSLSSREVVEEVGRRVKLDEWASQRYEKTGYLRWQSMLHFFSIDCIKAGYLVKTKGVWYVTPEGTDALKLGEDGLLRSARERYRAWKDGVQQLTPEDQANEALELEPEPDFGEQQLSADEALGMAVEGIKFFLDRKNPYEFQDIVAALLRGMGYFTPVVAPPGKDGGIDIVVYRDPLGTLSPRMRIQVKHRGSSSTVQEIRELIGTLQKDGDVGIFVSSGGFTPDAKQAARHARVHVELIDMDRFIALWKEFYPKLSDEDKSLLPLVPVYFVAPPS